MGGAEIEPLSTVQGKFDACTTETEVVMRLTEYLGYVSAGTHIVMGWPSNPYMVSKVALHRLTGIVSESLANLAGKRYAHGVTCLSVDPGWIATAMGGSDAPGTVEDGARVVVSHILRALTTQSELLSE